MKSKKKNNIQNEVIKDVKDSKTDYGYTFSPDLANSPNQDEQRMRARRLQDISEEKK